MREEAEVLRREPLDQRTLAHLLHFLTLAALYAGDSVQALAPAEESLALYRRLGDIQGIVISLTALGMTALAAGEPERAKAFFEENLNLLRTMGDKIGIAYCLLGLAGVAGERGRPERAARLWGAAEALREDIGMQLSPLDRSQHRYEERLASARSLIDESTWHLPDLPLPTITEAVTINGYAQAGASRNTLAEGNDAVLKVQLNGANAGSANGLAIQAANSTIRGLAINRFGGNGVLFSGSGASGNRVEGNFIGTGANGDDNSFSCVSPVPQAGQTVTATATNTSGTASGTSIGDTSEFSRIVGVAPGA